MRTTKTAAGIAAVVLFAGLSGFTFAPAPDAPCDPNAPGSCDKYKPGDPFVDDGKPPVPGPKTIVMKTFTIFPATVTGKPGEEWTEDNRDIATHNLTTMTDLDKHKGDKKYTGGNIAPDVMGGQKAKFKMPKKPGTYKMVCFYHQQMQLTVHVK
ncbi:MAG TPA: plastocyanin/azurin family copper-binding protein [Sporichthyaceae bacterium]|jgi:plastocyanin|nr:plastocyanin/azurin family copper-binding protein [Sporichthyaceae bacterium]